MRRLLFTGSPDWDDTRAISHLFLDLRSNRDILYCDMKSGAGSIAYDMGERLDYKVFKYTEWSGRVFDCSYMYLWDDDSRGLRYLCGDIQTLAEGEATTARQLSVTITHRRRPPTPETTPVPPADPDGTL